MGSTKAGRRGRNGPCGSLRAGIRSWEPKIRRKYALFLLFGLHFYCSGPSIVRRLSTHFAIKLLNGWGTVLLLEGRYQQPCWSWRKGECGRFTGEAGESAQDWCAMDLLLTCLGPSCQMSGWAWRDDVFFESFKGCRASEDRADRRRGCRAVSLAGVWNGSAP